MRKAELEKFKAENKNYQHEVNRMAQKMPYTQFKWN